MTITFEKNSRDKYMYDMVIHPKKGDPYVAAVVMVYVVGDMGLDNYEGEIGKGKYKDFIEAEIV